MPPVGFSSENTGTAPRLSNAAEGSLRPLRADARRNHDKLVAAAREAFAAHGLDAPLDPIAQRAGVGSGTLYRHFPTRDELMQAVYRGEIDALCDRGRELAASPEPAGALVTWLRMLADLADRRGLAAALYERFGSDPPSPFLHASKKAMGAAAAPLLRRAQEAGAVRPDVTVPELLKLTHAVARVSEDAGESRRLLSLLLDGLAPR
jgi:AcrR family transcriptional regulator